MFIIKKTKKSLEKKHVKHIKIFLKKRQKSTNKLMRNIEIFLKKKKKRSINMVVNDIIIFQWMSIKKRFLECRKSRIFE